MYFTKLVLMLVLSFTITFAGSAIAGYYFVGRDEYGIYLETDQNGSWYIDKEDLTNFRVGDRGTYAIETDRNGTYLLFGDKNRFYIDVVAREKQVSDNRIFNQTQTDLSNRIKTKVIIKDNQVLVPTRLGLASGQLKALLLLDTGASITTINREIVAGHKIDYQKRVYMTVPGGGTISADIARARFLKVGPKKKLDVQIAVIDNEGPKSHFDGLLGMNFLRDFVYRIDYNNQCIIWR
jgi:hypothetical protein